MTKTSSPGSTNITKCEFCGPVGRCIYVSGHGGEHFQNDGCGDYSDEIRLRLLRDAQDVQEATITALRAALAEALQRWGDWAEGENSKHSIAQLDRIEELGRLVGGGK